VFYASGSSAAFSSIKDDGSDQATLLDQPAQGNIAFAQDLYYNPDELPNTILYITTKGLYKSNLDGSNSVELDYDANNDFRALVYTGGKIYYTNYSTPQTALNKNNNGGTGIIHEINIDGTGKVNLFTGLASPYGITTDGTNIYWTEYYATPQSALAKTNVGNGNIVKSSIAAPTRTSITIENDAKHITYGNGKLYWTDYATGKIRRSNTTDGSDKIDFLDLSGDNPLGIEFNPIDNRLYYSVIEMGGIGNPVMLNKNSNSSVAPPPVGSLGYTSINAAVDFRFKSSLSDLNGVSPGPSLNTSPPPPPEPYIITNTGGTLDEGGTFTFSDLILKASNPDGVSYSITYNILSGPNYGSITSEALLKTGMSSSFTQNDIANGKVKYIHDGSESTSDEFAFSLVDAEGDESGEYVFEFTINPVNEPPVFSDIPDINMEEDGELTLNLSDYCMYVTDPDTPDSLLMFSLSINCNDVITTEISENNCLITLNNNWCGSAPATITVSDGVNSDSKSLNLIVSDINDLPILGELPDSISLDYMGSTSLTVTASDVETADSLLVFGVTSNEAMLDTPFINGLVTITALQGYSGSTEIEVTVTDEAGATDSKIIIIIVSPDPTNINESDNLPTEFTVAQNYPNPFNPTTNIKFGVPEDSHVKISVYNLLGENLAQLFEENVNAGYHSIIWNAGNLPSGIYIYKVNMRSLHDNNSLVKQKKMLLIK